MSRPGLRLARVAALSILLGGVACIEGDPVGPPPIECEADPDCNQATPCEVGRCVDNRCLYTALPEAQPGGGDLDGDGICDAGDNDPDDDGVVGIDDVCPYSEPRPPELEPNEQDRSNPYADPDGDGCVNLEDDDRDGDGIPNADDACPLSVNPEFVSGPRTDANADGCEDGRDNEDDDGDGVLNNADACPRNDAGWLSTPATDRDADGCRDGDPADDLGPDVDNDNDGVLNARDACDGPESELDWFSTPGTDRDFDGCRDDTEDDDDDNDGLSDEADRRCPRSPNVGPAFRDRDDDGCEDALEDDDDDNDDVPDALDRCPETPVDPGRQVDEDPDRDRDGCADDEDDDDDGDGVLDAVDACNGPGSRARWNSFEQTDRDGDGCLDAGEDPDDDDDGLYDAVDQCPTDAAWDDPDEDGCPADIDPDDDNDGVLDDDDRCPEDYPRAGMPDHDADGCADVADDDDDDDGVLDGRDRCPMGVPRRVATPPLDHDGDGCIDGREDDDDDDDGRLDVVDLCPVGETGWISDRETDYDQDGCRDAGEDDDDDEDGVPDGDDCAPLDESRAPGLPELCDDADNDCDEVIDEGARQVYYLDADGDGFGDPARRARLCPGAANYVADGTDCDDTDAGANPRDGCPVVAPDRQGVWVAELLIDMFSREGDDVCIGEIRFIIDVDADPSGRLQVFGEYACRFEGLLALTGRHSGDLTGTLSADALTIQGQITGSIEGAFGATFGSGHLLGGLFGRMQLLGNAREVETFFEAGPEEAE